MPIYSHYRTMKIQTVYEQTNVPHIYAIGDAQQNKEELTPMAIQSGSPALVWSITNNTFDSCEKLGITDEIHCRLCVQFRNVPSGRNVGLAEEDALKIYGEGREGREREREQASSRNDCFYQGGEKAVRS